MISLASCRHLINDGHIHISKSRDGQGPGNGVAVIIRTSGFCPFSRRIRRWETPKRCCFINNDQALDLGSELPLESRHVSPQSVELFLRRSPLRLLVSQLPFNPPVKRAIGKSGKDFASFPCVALPKSPLEPSRLLAYQRLKLHTSQDQPRLSSCFPHPLEASGSYDKEKPYLSRFHSSCFLELALAQKGSCFSVLLIFLDPRPGKFLAGFVIFFF